MVKKPSFIYIHGKFYDLEKIKHEHPGGCLKIFDSIENEEDCSSIFESSHAMKDVEYITEMLKNFEIKINQYEFYGITNKEIETRRNKNTKFSYESYRRLGSEVKLFLGENYKATSFWHFKISITLFCYILFYYYGIFSRYYEGTLRHFLAFLAGVLWVSMFLCVTHEASHYSLFNSKSKSILNNDFFYSIWSGWGLFNSYIWFKHHTYAHHSFVGMFEKDPDTINWRPFIRKSKNDFKVFNFFGKYQDKLFLIVWILIPGIFQGTVIAYMIGFFKGRVFRVNIKDAFLKTPFYEKILYFSSLICLIISRDMFSVIFYLFGQNLTYAIAIIPDHDSFESTIENEKNTDDWAERAIRKSDNFLNDSIWFTIRARAAPD